MTVEVHELMKRHSLLLALQILKLYVTGLWGLAVVALQSSLQRLLSLMEIDGSACLYQREREREMFRSELSVSLYAMRIYML